MVLECEVKNCKRRALLLFGNKWICGECFMKIRNKQLDEQNKLVDDLGDEDDKNMS